MAQGMDGVTAMQTVEAQWKEIGVVQGDIYDSAMIKGVGLQVIQAKVALGIITEDQAAQQMQQQYDSVRKDYPQLTDQQFNAVYSFGLQQGAATTELAAEAVAMEVGGRLIVKVGGKVIELVRGGQAVSNTVKFDLQLFAEGGEVAKAATGTINPGNIRFTQNSISATFQDGRTVSDLVNGLKTGEINATNISPIRVFEKDGQIFTLDNRRLYAYQEAGVEILYRWATAEEVSAEAWKFTTTNGGTSIRVRGGGTTE